MSNKSLTARQRHRWRLLLLLFVVLPFLPELAILLIAGLAKLGGCAVDQICRPAGIEVSRTIAALVSIALYFAGLGLAAVWLLISYLLIARGWAGIMARALLGICVSLIFAWLPYVAPFAVVDLLTSPACRPTEGGVPPCRIFGAEVDGVHQAFILSRWEWWTSVGIPVALVAIAIFLIGAAIRFWRTRTERPPARLPE